jgi:hypothetical protein
VPTGPKGASACLIAFAFLLPLQAFAQTGMGMGHSSCGAWTKAQNSNDIRDQTLSAMMGQWVAGYLSAVAVFMPISDGLLRTDWEGIRHWIDNYCQAHPLNSVNDAAAALSLDLVKD